MYSRNFGKLPSPSIFEKLGNWETSIVPIVRVRVTVGLGLGLVYYLHSSFSYIGPIFKNLVN